MTGVQTCALPIFNCIDVVSKEIFQREVLLQLFVQALDCPASSVRLAYLFCRHLLYIKHIGDKFHHSLLVISPSENPTTAECTMHTILNGHNPRLWSPATTMTHFFLCQCTFHVLVIRELNYLIGNDVLCRALPLLNNLEFGIVLQTADELIKL